MKKILFALAILVSFSFSADKTVLEICNTNFCYDQILVNAKKWEWKTDFNGRKFVRVYFYDNRILDIMGDNKTIKKKK